MTGVDEWGRVQALAAAPWSEARWLAVCAILGRGGAVPDEKDGKT